MRRRIITASLLATMTLAAGCATQSSTNVSMGAMTPRPASTRQVLTLGSGDSLGVAIHTNDVVLAMLRDTPAVDRITDAQALDQAALMGD